MNCQRCSQDPTFHSFEFLGRLDTGDGIFYTCPAKGKQLQMKEEHIGDYIAHMDGASMSSWVWVFDCSGLQSLQMPSLPVLQKFVGLVQERYKFVLKSIYLINMNWKMHMILNMAKPFMKDETQKRLLIINSRIELLARGIHPKVAQKLHK
jgi:hypothetical protein